MDNEGFYKCPQCGTVETERRTRCACGYTYKPAGLAAAPPKPRGRRIIGCSVWLFLIPLGLIIYGYHEYRLSEGASAEPVPVEIADLEAGKRPAQNHIRIGKHSPVWDQCIYSVSPKDKDKPDPLVFEVLYPVISPSKLDHWDGKVTVLVETHRFGRVSDIQKDKVRVVPEATGMLVNSIRSLREEEARLIREGLPDQDLENVLILQEGRKPTSQTWALVIMGAGIALGILIILGIAASARGDDD
jgi:hypothetical protein